MKNIFIYYLAILLPIAFIAWYVVGPHDPVIFVVLLFCYCVFRGFTDGKRLIDKGVVKGESKWKVYIPFYINHLTYFRELYLKR